MYRGDVFGGAEPIAIGRIGLRQTSGGELSGVVDQSKPTGVDLGLCTGQGSGMLLRVGWHTPLRARPSAFFGSRIIGGPVPVPFRSPVYAALTAAGGAREHGEPDGYRCGGGRVPLLQALRDLLGE